MLHPAWGVPAALELLDAPADLTADERTIWLLQAPYACANRTLTRASALAFARYCRLVVYERAEAAAERLSGKHVAVLKGLNTLELQFGLTPCGKPMPDAAPATTRPAALAKYR